MHFFCNVVSPMDSGHPQDSDEIATSLLVRLSITFAKSLLAPNVKIKSSYQTYDIILSIWPPDRKMGLSENLKTLSTDHGGFIFWFMAVPFGHFLCLNHSAM